ncbi:MAG TPA: PilW family protein [Gallionella sp.]|nr:PilW family protein [Gallionella sp.]
MKSGNPYASLRHTGFTLVEIMVGMAIGMLATLVIMQVFSVFETQKRTTTGTADAQTNGGIALYNIARELQVAGYPLMPIDDSPLECTTLTVNGTADTTVPNRLSPVALTDGASDTITLRYGNSLAGGIPTTIGALTGNDATVDNSFGCLVGDTTLIVNGTTCALSSASAVPDTTTVTLANTAVAIAGANLSCLGTWNEITYTMNNGNLERNGVPSVAGIVNLQVQYGVSAAANSNQVTAWVNANNANADGIDWAAPAVADRNRIKAIRIAVVARNPKMESIAVTAACSSLTDAAPTGLCAWEGSVASPAPAIDLSAVDPDWLRYRYRVFETIIPLRNMIWSRDTL